MTKYKKNGKKLGVLGGMGPAAAAAVPAGAGKTKIKDYLIEIVLFFMLILLHHTAS